MENDCINAYRSITYIYVYAVHLYRHLDTNTYMHYKELTKEIRDFSSILVSTKKYDEYRGFN